MAGLVALPLLSFVSQAQAADADKPFYIGAQGNVAMPSDSTITGASSGKVKYGFSSGAGVVMGYQPQALSNDTGDVRVEAEASYHALGLKSVGANNNPSGDLKATTLMGNVYYDVHTGTNFTPYVGAGVGQAFVSFPKGQGLGNTGGTSNVLAYQGMAGVSYTPDSMPNTDISLGYKYLGTEKPNFSTASGDVKLDPLHQSSVELGVKYHF
jgi:opacity protein-like surface antigen